jgi:hypothetical protein
MTARFLRDKADRIKAVERINDNMTGVKSSTWKWGQVKEALLDPKTWFFFFFQLSQTVPNCVGTVSCIPHQNEESSKATDVLFCAFV